LASLSISEHVDQVELNTTVISYCCLLLHILEIADVDIV